MTQYFSGTYHNSIDSKGRVVVPARFRDKLGSKFMLGCGYDKCLVIYDMEDWERFAERLASLPTNSPKARKLQRYFFGGTEEVEIDQNGRALLPKELDDVMSKVGIDKRSRSKVVFVGDGHKAELWAEDVYNELHAMEDPEDAQMQREELDGIAAELLADGYAL